MFERPTAGALALWFGKPFDAQVGPARPGVRTIAAVRDGRVRELPPETILLAGSAGPDRVKELLVTREPADLPAQADPSAGGASSWNGNCSVSRSSSRPTWTIQK